tara:strand:- start:676 stop:942 length:267 start_codon:yes stop_codon:yes gene_type:complete
MIDINIEIFNHTMYIGKFIYKKSVLLKKPYTITVDKDKHRHCPPTIGDHNHPNFRKDLCGDPAWENCNREACIGYNKCHGNICNIYNN